MLAHFRGRKGRFYFSSAELKLSKFCLSFTPDAARPRPSNNPPRCVLPFPPSSPHFIFPSLCEWKRWWRSVDWLYVCGVWGGRWGIQTAIRSRLSPSRPAAAFSLVGVCSPRTLSGCVAASKQSFHSCMSAAHQLGPLTVDLPAWCEGRTRAIFPPWHCS